MSPQKELNQSQFGFLSDLLNKFGHPVNGDPFEVPMADGKTHLLVLGSDFVHAEDGVLTTLGAVLDGKTLFQAPRADELAPRRQFQPDTDLQKVFGNRIANALLRGGESIRTVAELEALLAREDGDLAFLRRNMLGEKSLEEVKRKLGL